ncbi:hypothetical protein GGR50DRAFT_492254 [Xylaria sp. CBS 124048]|nr:hypothetical protein GGR50DRAFT_492254 [Xylaria sp. CBS 124048]
MTRKSIGAFFPLLLVVCFLVHHHYLYVCLVCVGRVLILAMSLRYGFDLQVEVSISGMRATSLWPAAMLCISEVRTPMVVLIPMIIGSSLG